MDLDREHIARRCALHMAIQLDSLAPNDEHVAQRAIEIVKALVSDYLIVTERPRREGTTGSIIQLHPPDSP